MTLQGHINQRASIEAQEQSPEGSQSSSSWQRRAENKENLDIELGNVHVKNSNH